MGAVSNKDTTMPFELTAVASVQIVLGEQGGGRSNTVLSCTCRARASVPSDLRGANSITSVHK